MKHVVKNLLAIFAILCLVGCAGAPQRLQPATDSVANAFGTDDYFMVKIPSHGLIGDTVAIAAGGGANAGNFRSALLELQGVQGSQCLAITSGNSLLAKTVLSSAVKELPVDSLTNIQVVFAGDVAHGEEVRPIVEATGAKFHVVRGKL